MSRRVDRRGWQWAAVLGALTVAAVAGLLWLGGPDRPTPTVVLLLAGAMFLAVIW